jgi:hypothetical protein
MRAVSRTGRSGLTLLEVMIGSLILSAVVMMAMSSLMSSSTTASKGASASELEQRGLRFLGFCRDDFSIAQFTKTINLGGTPWVLGIPLNSYSTAIAYRIPGTRDAAGVALPGGAMAFGYTSPLSPPYSGFYQDLACLLRFEAETVLKESTSSIAAVQAANWGTPFSSYPTLVDKTLGLDLNGDGNRTDTFVSGKIVRYILAPSGSAVGTGHPAMTWNGVTQSPLLLPREVLSDEVVLRVNSTSPGDFLADFDGHATSPASAIDALFRFVDSSGSVDGTLVDNSNVATTGKGVLIGVVHAKPDTTGKGYIVRKNSLLVRFVAAQ